MIRRAAALAAARLAGTLSRAARRGGGTSLPGAVLLGLDPGAIGDRAARAPGGATLISATNGKTTTARLLVAVLRERGDRVLANPGGANLLSGIASALATGHPRRPDRLVFEVDEAALPEVARRVRPRTVVLMNLFRDQLDRYGELEALVARWGAMIDELPRDALLVVNADDPGVAALADGRRRSVSFGVDDRSHAIPALPHAADATRCRVCDARLDYEAVLLGHMGHWACPAGHVVRARPDVAVERLRLDGTRGMSLALRTPAGPVAVDIPLPGLHNAYNAAAAVAAAVALGAEPPGIERALAAARAAFGRAERVRIDGRELVVLLAKNPAGANETVRTVLLDGDGPHVLMALNDRTADGHDVSWIWDVDYEPLIARGARMIVTGDRAYDAALRFRYADLPDDRLCIEPDPDRALDALLAATPAGGVAYVLPTYTAMLGLRETLVRRGAAESFWREG